MSALLATFQRELRAYFLSPLAWVVLFFFLAVNGTVFALLVSLLSDPRVQAGRPFDFFFTGFPFWVVMLAVVPLLTMRLVAEERRSGSMEVLMTAPVTEGQVILGKYLAALVFFAFLWSPTVLYGVLVDRFSDVDWGILAAGYLGILLVGGLFLSIGVLASSLARNQIVAAVICFALLLLVFLLAFLAELVTDPVVGEVLAYVSVLDHVGELSRGVVDTRRLVFYPSVSGLFLFAAARALEDRKWR